MMNKLRSVLVLGLLVLGAYALFDTRPASAQTPPGQVSTIVKRAPASATLVAVAAGAVINSGTQTLDTAVECSVYADNSLGGSARTLNINFLADDGTTIVYQQAITVALATRGVAVIARSVAAAAVPTGFTLLPTPPSKFMSFQLSAAGAAAGSLQWTCR